MGTGGTSTWGPGRNGKTSRNGGKCLVPATHAPPPATAFVSKSGLSPSSGMSPTWLCAPRPAPFRGSETRDGHGELGSHTALCRSGCLALNHSDESCERTSLCAPRHTRVSGPLDASPGGPPPSGASCDDANVRFCAVCLGNHEPTPQAPETPYPDARRHCEGRTAKTQVCSRGQSPPALRPRHLPSYPPPQPPLAAQGQLKPRAPERPSMLARLPLRLMRVHR